MAALTRRLWVGRGESSDDGCDLERRGGVRERGGGSVDGCDLERLGRGGRDGRG